MSSYPVGSLVWVKMPGYPWWPGAVVDADTVNADSSLRAPEQDLCVQCFPSSAPSVMFVSSSSADEVRAYRGDDVDRELITAGRASAECAAAVEEAVALSHNAAAGSEAAPANGLVDELDVEETLNLLMEDGDKLAQHSGAAAAEAADGADDEALLLGTRSGAGDTAAHSQSTAHAETDEERAARHQQRKLRKKMEKEAAKKAKSRHDKSIGASKKHARGLSDEDDGEDDAPPRKLKKAARTSADPRDQRQSLLEEYKREARRAPDPLLSDEGDGDYYRKKLQSMRQRVPNATLAECARQLQEVTGDCLETGAYEEKEEALLTLLRPLAAYDVTYEQLCATGIGSVVGGVLRKSFPARVVELARGIIAYWFRALPAHMQSELSMDSEMDRCSVETTAGARSDDVDGALEAVGIHLYESFTDEEIYDAPPGTNVVEICKTLEKLLRENSDELDTRVMVLTTLGDPKNTALRRGILDGKFTPQDILANASDLTVLLRGVNARGLPNIQTDFSSMGSPTTPFTPFSPTGFGGGGARGSDGAGSGISSPTGGGMGTFTTLYACPSCGAAEAYRTEYTVQAHDNFPEIMRCRKCGHTWNVAE